LPLALRFFSGTFEPKSKNTPSIMLAILAPDTATLFFGWRILTKEGWIGMEGTMRRSLNAAMIIAALTVPANAGQTFIGMGPGTFTCGQFSKWYAQNPSHTDDNFFFWAQGYMSGMNIALASDTKHYRDMAAIATETQQFWIRQYCDAHPLAGYTDAVFDVFKKLPMKPMPNVSNENTSNPFE
jgi:hypothetical protein